MSMSHLMSAVTNMLIFLAVSGMIRTQNVGLLIGRGVFGPFAVYDWCVTGVEQRAGRCARVTRLRYNVVTCAPPPSQLFNMTGYASEPC